MRKLFVLLAALGLLASVASCETLNIGGAGPFRFSVTGVTFNPTAPVAGDDVTATVNFQGVNGPFTFDVHFGSGVTPADQTVTAPNGATSATLTFTLDKFTAAAEPTGRTIAVTVHGEDSLGVVGDVSGSFHVTGTLNDPPVISGVAAGGTVTITSTDTEGDDVTVVATAPAGFAPATDTKTITGGNGTVDFNFSATDILTGASGDISFASSDPVAGAGNTIAVTVNLPSFTPAADTLYAVPTSTSVAPATPVTIIVLTGDPASPFQYMTGVRVTFPTTAGVAYVKKSFNVGAVGNDPDVVDGAWTSMGIADGDFLLATDSFYQVVDVLGDPTHQALDFNVTPLGGSDQATFSGALFNFAVTFANAGSVPLRFEQTNQVNRTYYQDGNQAPDYFWGDITNDHPEVPNTVTVN